LKKILITSSFYARLTVFELNKNFHIIFFLLTVVLWFYSPARAWEFSPKRPRQFWGPPVLLFNG